jgi:methyl-accepting chemotaxis protein
MGEEKQSALAEAQASLAEANRKLFTDDQIELALVTFEQIMAYRSEMYLRLSARVRTTVRGGMAVFAMVGLAMFVLLATLVMQVEHAYDTTTQLERHVITVAADMRQIQATIKIMEDRMKVFSSIGDHMNVMRKQTGKIADEMGTLDGDMNTIEKHMTTINGRLVHITQSMGAMGQAVNGMGHSIHEVARPAGMFNILP